MEKKYIKRLELISNPDYWFDASRVTRSGNSSSEVLENLADEDSDVVLTVVPEFTMDQFYNNKITIKSSAALDLGEILKEFTIHLGVSVKNGAKILQFYSEEDLGSFIEVSQGDLIVFGVNCGMISDSDMEFITIGFSKELEILKLYLNGRLRCFQVLTEDILDTIQIKESLEVLGSELVPTTFNTLKIYKRLLKDDSISTIFLNDKSRYKNKP